MLFDRLSFELVPAIEPCSLEYYVLPYLEEGIEFNGRVHFFVICCNIGRGENIVCFLPKAVEQRVDLLDSSSVESPEATQNCSKCFFHLGQLSGCLKSNDSGVLSCKFARAISRRLPPCGSSYYYLIEFDVFIITAFDTTACM